MSPSSDTPARAAGSSRPVRSALLALALAGLLVTAGCASVVPGMGSDGASTGPVLSTVPASADAVGYVNVQGMRTDDTLRSLANETLSMRADQPGYDGPTTVDEMLSQAQADSDLDPIELASVTYFGTFPDPNATRTRERVVAGQSVADFGFVLSTTWSEDALTSALTNDTSVQYEDATHAGKTLYRPTGRETDTRGAWLGVVDDTKYVLGTERAVKDALDVAAGDADPLGGSLERAFEDTHDGYVRFASSVPQRELPRDALGPGQATSKLTTVSGALYTDGETVGTQVSLAYQSESAATDARDVFKGAVTTYRGLAEDNRTKQLLSEENLSIEREDTSVVVTSQNDVGTLVGVLHRLYGSPTTGSAGASRSASGTERTSVGA